jgi:excisionase family DNA binding protein
MTNTTVCQPIARRYYSITEAMILTGLARGTLITAIKEARLKAYKPTPRRVVIAAEDLDAFCRTNPVGPTETPAA